MGSLSAKWKQEGEEAAKVGFPEKARSGMSRYLFSPRKSALCQEVFCNDTSPFNEKKLHLL